MYSAPYGYGNAAGQPFSGPATGPTPQMQPGPGPNQPQQQMMYNQQYPMGPGGAFSGAANPGAMMSGPAGPAGMMQNTAMPQMAANGQMGFQAPYTSSPYGPNVPSTAAPPGQFNPSYMMGGSMGGYPMNAGGMNPQQQQQQQIMMQRMHQAQQQSQAAMGTPNQQRQFSVSQGTPNPPQQSHFGTPQNNPQGTPQNQTPTPAPPSAHSVTTPQTPTFPPMGPLGPVNGNAAPLSPGTQARDQERMGLLLDINTELLYEVVHLKNSLEEIRKEAANAGQGVGPELQKERKEEEEAFDQDYSQVFRRLQANLQYMANLTSNKPGIPRQPAPIILSAPPLNLKLKPRPLASAPDAETVDVGADREERDAYIRDLYKKLHALFPGMDPTKEPSYRPQQKAGGPGPNPLVAAQNAQRLATMAAAQGQMQMNSAPSPVPSAHHTTPQMATLSRIPSTQAPSTSV